MYPDPSTSRAVLDTLWLIRHVVHSLRLRRPLPLTARRTLAARQLDAADCLQLLTRLARLLPAPLAVGPPCSPLCSEHERQIGLAVAALEAGDADALKGAIQSLASPVGLARPQARDAGVLLARLAGYDESMPCRCPSGNGGEAMARTPHGFSP